ncbi:DUF5677 domain-containing protein [Kiloniella majae]|uniref:DUF5677 domain-containing protein n=1 Tax=Kiloniella majae TaxID=1938558 RepID=UPI000A278FEB|nr:DUF5677 domain-containing protein [Kiloniella majae]
MRDSISLALGEHLDDQPKFKRTVWGLVLYQSERSQVVSYLASSNFVWDAEMILRSFYEANVKIWYLCSLQGADREAAVEEFWGAFLDVHAHKRRVKAGLVKSVSQNLRREFHTKIFSALEDDKINQFYEGNKKDRRDVEQRWSFSSLIKKLETTPKNILDFSSIRALEHSFGLQSHLLHADVSALDLMHDRKIRSAEELEALTGSHVCRIFSDQISIWAMTSIAVWSATGTKCPKGDEIASTVDKVHKLIRPFSERFEASQSDSYQ